MSTVNEDKKLIQNKSKIAFVASGGAIKAACFHIGVMLAMERFGFSFLGGLKKDHENEPEKPGQVSIYVGSSAGSFLTGLVAGGYTPEEMYNYLSESFKNNKKIPSALRPILYRDITGNNIFSNFSTALNSMLRFKKSKTISLEGAIQTFLGINGMFNTKNVGKYIRNAIATDNFQDLAAELYMVTTELDNPNRIICGSRELEPSVPCNFATDVGIADAAMGSMSLPFIFGPHKLNIKGKDTYVFDGEIRKTLSTHVAKDAGADLIIASYTHQPYQYNSEYGSLINYGLTTILVQTIYQLVESKIRSAKVSHDIKLDVVEEIESFFKEKGLPDHLKNEFVERMAERMKLNRNLDYIYIAPEPEDARMFFEDHFNLSLKSMGKIIRSGFKSAYHSLNKYQFDFNNHVAHQQERNSDNLLTHT